MPRGAHDPLLLLPADTRRRAAIVPLRPRTDFDEHQRAVAIAHHEIDFAATARHVTRDEPQALPLQEFLRARLESGADEFRPS